MNDKYIAEKLSEDISGMSLPPISPEVIQAMHERREQNTAVPEHHHSFKKKRRRFIPLLVAAVTGVIVFAVGTAAVTATPYLTSDEQMQAILTERFNARVEEIRDNEQNMIAEKYRLTDEDLTAQAKADPDGKYMQSVKAEAAAEERQKVCDIVNKYYDNKYEGYNGYYMIDPDEKPSYDDRIALYDFVSDCAKLYIYGDKEYRYTDKERYGKLTVEEKMMILNYLDDVIFEIEDKSYIDYQYYYEIEVKRRNPSDDYFEFLKKYPFIDKISYADKMCQSILLSQKFHHDFKTYYPERTTESEYIKNLQLLIESETGLAF